jgi:TonB family protein
VLAYLLAAGVQAAAAADAAPLPEARWKRIPSVYERALAYPEHAAARGISGEATLKCRINDLGMPVSCSVYAETPAGEGFGKALMKLRSKMSFHPPAPGESPWSLIRVGFDADPKKALHIY